eukprot:993488-Amphidinium_carterae.1
MSRQAEGIHTQPPTGQAVAAAVLLRALLSCLRHRHMLRASIEVEASNDRLFAIFVSRGKTRGGAAFKVAVPSLPRTLQPTIR